MNKHSNNDIKNSIRSRNIGNILVYISVIPIAVVRGILGSILTLIIFGAAVYFLRQYKCPFCGYVFDPRVRPDEIKYCNKCSEKI